MDKTVSMTDDEDRKLTPVSLGFVILLTGKVRTITMQILHIVILFDSY